MDFTIQYFGMFDQLHYVESVDVGELVDAPSSNSPAIHNQSGM
jgi:hypothetical protein